MQDTSKAGNNAAADVDSVCHALKKSDGERCTNAVHGTRFCGKHESMEMRGGEVGVSRLKRPHVLP